MRHRLLDTENQGFGAVMTTYPNCAIVIFSVVTDHAGVLFYLLIQRVNYPRKCNRVKTVFEPSCDTIYVVNMLSAHLSSRPKSIFLPTQNYRHPVI